MHYENFTLLTFFGLCDCHTSGHLHHAIIDYILGAEDEHPNAWVIVNRLFGNETTIGDSLAIRHFGLADATFIMLAVNTIFGVTLIQLIKLFIRIVHS